MVTHKNRCKAVCTSKTNSRKNNIIVTSPVTDVKKYKLNEKIRNYFIATTVKSTMWSMAYFHFQKVSEINGSNGFPKIVYK